jgi:hypothetical protein
MRWHLARIEAADRLAAQTLAVAGITATILGTIAVSMWHLVAPERRALTVYGIVAALALLVAASTLAIISLVGRVRKLASKPEEVQDLWLLHRLGPRRNSPDLLSDLASALIGEPGQSTAAIVDLRNAADRREARSRAAATVLGVGIVLVSCVLASTLIIRVLPIA